RSEFCGRNGRVPGLGTDGSYFVPNRKHSCYCIVGSIRYSRETSQAQRCTQQFSTLYPHGVHLGARRSPIGNLARICSGFPRDLGSVATCSDRRILLSDGLRDRPTGFACFLRNEIAVQHEADVCVHGIARSWVSAPCQLRGLGLPEI